jgi:hypothetical protein
MQPRKRLPQPASPRSSKRRAPPGPCPPNRGTETELETLLNHTVGHPVAPKFIKPNASIYERPQGCHGAPLPPFGDDSPRHSPLEALRARCVSRRVLATRLAHGTQPSLPVSHRGDQKRRRCCAAGGCETPASEEGGAGRQKEAGRWRGRTGIVGCGLASLCSMWVRAVRGDGGKMRLVAGLSWGFLRRLNVTFGTLSGRKLIGGLIS